MAARTKCDRKPTGLAALSICEALLLALNNERVSPESEIIAALEDAAAAHEKMHGSLTEREQHQAVAALMNRIIAGANSVRRP